MKEKLTIVLLVLHLCAHTQTASPYNVVIDEIMADPIPVAGLPNTEFIELRNVSAQAFNLNGWQIGDATGFATININFVLQADSFVVICPNSAAPALSVFGTTIGVSNFPSLDNDGDELYLRSKEGSIIHAVNYHSDWYQNAVKSQGGWTLEMADTKNPCSGFSNWIASNDPKGGTPGKKNSADAINKDQQPPVLLHAFAADSINIVLLFDEPLDSIKAAKGSNYIISDNIGIAQSAVTIAPFFNKVQLRTTALIATDKVYTITATGVTDCAGNSIGAYHTVKLGRAAAADTADLAINEILFNPKPGGTDYIELYNRSKSIIDVKDCYIASRSLNGTIGSIKQMSADNRLLFPGEYIVVTEDAFAIKKQYLAKDPAAFAVITAMPSLPDDKGDVLILNAQGKVIDELNYDAHWHFKLIGNDEGISLERIDYNKPTQDAGNWHSAATSAGYGTPGYQNSQFRSDVQLPGNIGITPAVFSPDNDGFDDFLTINYQFPDQGYVCNITIFDANGRIVRYLIRNAVCSLQGYFRWDGLDEKNGKLPVGVYVVFSEVFNLQGKTKRLKQAVTLARRL
ncbi:MAG: lamin tail domain-containing protein [Chitinophagaceae bacterium]